jgi:hypothetical protein
MKSLFVAVALLGCSPVSQVGTQGQGSGGTADAPASNSVGVIGCSASECDLEQGQVCCLQVSTGSGTCSTDACPMFSSTVSCDGPEDCNGNACCGSIGEGMSCTSETACASGVQLCHDDGDCTANQPTCCTVIYGTMHFRGCTTAPTGQCS